jgi:hypothetical protein
VTRLGFESGLVLGLYLGAGLTLAVAVTSYFIGFLT